jgi:hypothetical protein
MFHSHKNIYNYKFIMVNLTVLKIIMYEITQPIITVSCEM